MAAYYDCSGMRLTLPSSFLMHHAKLDDLEAIEGLGCQVTRLVCQVLYMPLSQQCLADG